MQRQHQPHSLRRFITSCCLLVLAATATGATAVCLSVTMPQHIEALAEGLDPYEGRDGIVLGGAAGTAQVAAALGVRHAGSTARRAVAALSRLAE